MPFLTIPEDRSGLSAADLRELASDVRRAAIETAQAGEATAEDVAAQRNLASLLVVESELLYDEEMAELSDEEPDDDEAEADGAEADGEPDVDVDVDVDSNASAPVVHIGTELATVESEPAVRQPSIRPDAIFASDSVGPVKAGQAFGSWGDFGMEALRRARSVKPGSRELVEVGYILGGYDEAHTLGDSAFDNLRKLDTLGMYDNLLGAEITASVCPPATPYYGMACMQSTARPVAASLPGFAAPRGNVTIYPSPSLAAVSGSAGIWTQADDANTSATKNTCARIACATSSTFGLYGVYWCLTVKNMELLTFPELVAAYLNRGAANFARVAEIQLLDAMGASLGEVKGPLVGSLNATNRVSTQILQYMTLYREQQRWDDVPMHGWAPRWLLNALRIDLSRRNSRGTARRFATEADVAAVFRDAGINMTWYMDNPSWGTPLPFLVAGNPPSAGTSAFLNQLPSEVDILVAPEGKFAMIDRAQVSLGVTGNNWYRDNTSNSKNEVTFFVENYEGVVNTTSCPAHILHWDGLCYNGAETADIAVNCLGVTA